MQGSSSKSEQRLPQNVAVKNLQFLHYLDHSEETLCHKIVNLLCKKRAVNLVTSF